MNKKLVVRDMHGDIRYCVLNCDEPLEPQLNKLLAITSGCGFCAEIDGKKLVIRDYFAGENRGEFEIISFKESGLPQNLNWVIE